MVPPLTSDVIDCILTSLPDLATLFSAILTSKSFYEVFQAHPSSTLASVATTQIGPEILSCAIRLAHFDRGEYLATRINYVQNFPLEGRFPRNGAPEVTSYVGTLSKNDNVARELELFFRISCKDRASGSLSSLNPRESLRFRRAFYRWWLFLNLLPPCYLRSARVARGNEGSEMEDDDDDDEEDITDSDAGADADDEDINDDDANIQAANLYLTEANKLRREFLSEFSNQEVLEMWFVHNFMVFVSLCTRNATLGSVTPDCGLLVYTHHVLRLVNAQPALDLRLWSGPSAAAGVLRTLRNFSKPEFRFPELLNWDFRYLDPIWPGFSEYLQEKDYDTSQVRTNIWDPISGSDLILDNEVCGTEACDDCLVFYLSPKLWSSSNWHLLACSIVFDEIVDSLPGHLNLNRHETQPLFIIPWSFPRFVDRHVSPGIQDWSEGKVLCKQCILKRLGHRALNSLRGLKAQSDPQPEDCWYGYRCRTQRRLTHAIKLNHLCEPTRGD